MPKEHEFEELEYQLASLQPMPVGEALESKLMAIPDSLDDNELSNTRLPVVKQTNVRSWLGSSQLAKVAALVITASVLAFCCFVVFSWTQSGLLNQQSKSDDTPSPSNVEFLVSTTKPTLVSFNATIKQGDNLSALLWQHSDSLLPNYSYRASFESGALRD